MYLDALQSQPHSSWFQTGRFISEEVRELDCDSTVLWANRKTSLYQIPARTAGLTSAPVAVKDNIKDGFLLSLLLAIYGFLIEQMESLHINKLCSKLRKTLKNLI